MVDVEDGSANVRDESVGFGGDQCRTALKSGVGRALGAGVGDDLLEDAVGVFDADAVDQAEKDTVEALAFEQGSEFDNELFDSEVPSRIRRSKLVVGHGRMGHNHRVAHPDVMEDAFQLMMASLIFFRSDFFRSDLLFKKRQLAPTVVAKRRSNV